MDVNSKDWSSREFNELSKSCGFKKDWQCSKTSYACKDYMCHIVKYSNSIEEMREKFAKQAK
jgi:hypothetical protein